MVISVRLVGFGKSAIALPPADDRRRNGRGGTRRRSRHLWKMPRTVRSAIPEGDGGCAELAVPGNDSTPTGASYRRQASFPEFSQQRTGWTLARANALCRAKTRLAVSLLACSYEAQTGKAFSAFTCEYFALTCFLSVFFPLAEPWQFTASSTRTDTYRYQYITCSGSRRSCGYVWGADGDACGVP